MEYISLGKTKLMVSRVGFGAMSLAQIDTEENAAILIHKAYDAGVNFFDISRKFPESQKRLGACLHGIRQNVVLATTTCSPHFKGIEADLDNSLFSLQTDYVDLFQYEVDEKNPLSLESVAAEMERLKAAGKIRHFGILTEDLETAQTALDSALFETLQFPFNVLMESHADALVNQARQSDTGFIAMRPLFSGLLRNIPLALGFLYQYENIVPLWGVRSLEELQEILDLHENRPVIDEALKSEMETLQTFFN